MADNMGYTDTCALHQDHASIRHDVAAEGSRLAMQIGAEACGINKHIGDVRQEEAENFGHTRRDIKDSEANMRAENAKHFADGRYAGATQAADIRADVRDVGRGIYEQIDTARDSLAMQTEVQTDRVVDRVTESKDMINDRLFIVGRDLASLQQGQATIAKDIELNSLKGMIEGQKNTVYLSDKITADGEKTRTLLNDLKYHDLNRGLVERHTELVSCEQDRRHWRHQAEQSQYGAQWAQLQNQVQAFQSQLQETRQGMVNFGTMAGVGQSSTSNNVR